MKCKHCDIEFRRPVEVPIQHDRCTSIHEEMDALGGSRQLGHTLAEGTGMKTNDENQDCIRSTLAAAINKIYEDHGVRITDVNAEWIDASTCEESEKILTFLEIGADL